MFAVIFCCLLVTLKFLVTKAVPPSYCVKKAPQKFCKTHRKTPVPESPFQQRREWHTLKITELPPGLEGKIMIYLIMWIYVAFIFFVYCSHYIYTKDLYQVFFMAYFSGFLPVSISIFNFNFSIDCVKCIHIFFL